MISLTIKVVATPTGFWTVQMKVFSENSTSPASGLLAGNWLIRVVSSALSRLESTSRGPACSKL